MTVPTDQRSAPEVSVCVFAPSPLLTVTVETSQAGGAEVHVHAGGQGVWVARMLASLGARVRLCGPFGGEPGLVLPGLVEAEHVEVLRVPVRASNGVYVQDRRSGQRETVAEMPPQPLSRHDVDELVTATLVEALDADACVLTGPASASLLPAVVYRRLAADLTSNGRTVVADLSGEQLDAVLGGRPTVLKISDEELAASGRTGDGGADDLDVEALAGALHQLAGDGAENVVLSRADRPTLALLGGRLVEFVPPRLQVVDHHGGGDSMTAGIAVGVARGEALSDAVRLGVAAGALNVTRRGLGTGHRYQVERLAPHVGVGPLRRRPGDERRQPGDVAAGAGTAESVP